MAIDRKQAKRNRLNALVQNIYEDIDSFVATDIPAIQADIDTLVANTNRTALQNVELRALRRDLKLLRFSIRIGRAFLLFAGRSRTEDIDATD